MPLFSRTGGGEIANIDRVEFPRLIIGRKLKSRHCKTASYTQRIKREEDKHALLIDK